MTRDPYMVHDHNLTSTAGNFLTTIGLLEDKFAATEGWEHSVPTKFLVSFSIISQNYPGRGHSWIEDRDSWTRGRLRRYENLSIKGVSTTTDANPHEATSSPG